ncbi:MAG: site-specific DNA-methyltransferase, partial [Dehalococcoidia bacterium]|nr:site-specific DNA-methyltransferase [Dehalococcoidia bacterium]
IHAVGRAIQGAPCNGWAHWRYRDPDSGDWRPIDALRQQFHAMRQATR